MRPPKSLADGTDARDPEALRETKNRRAGLSKANKSGTRPFRSRDGSKSLCISRIGAGAAESQDGSGGSRNPGVIAPVRPLPAFSACGANSGKQARCRRRARCGRGARPHPPWWRGRTAGPGPDEPLVLHRGDRRYHPGGAWPCERRRPGPPGSRRTGRRRCPPAPQQRWQPWARTPDVHPTVH